MPRGRAFGRGGTQKYARLPIGDPRFQRLVSGEGGAVTPTPTVITVGINTITTTTANVIGAVNPNGQDTVWWVSYGTALPLPSGVTTVAVDVGSGFDPVTVTTGLTGLVANEPYYVAVVAQNAGGTQYGQTFPFVTAATTPQPPFPPASSQVAPFGQLSVTIPHFRMPFSIQYRDGAPQGALVVEQDTLDEIVANVNVILDCPAGSCLQLPAFGRPDLTFAQAPIDTAELTTAIQRWEPRATENAVSSLLLDGTTWGITLTTSATTAENI